jgi:flagellar motor switch protein FliM
MKNKLEKELFKKPFRFGKVHDTQNTVILDANGHQVFVLNRGQYSNELALKILNSINGK